MRQYFVLLISAAASPVFAQHKMRAQNVVPEAEGTATSVLKANFANLPLVEGHGSYFDKSFSYRDPIKDLGKRNTLDKVTLEILSNHVGASRTQCPLLAATWFNSLEMPQSSDKVCRETEFLVKVWASSQNQAKNKTCICVSQKDYQNLGISPDRLSGLPTPVVGNRLALTSIQNSGFSVFRSNGTIVPNANLKNIFAEDLGPGAVDMRTGTRKRNVRLYSLNAQGKFVPMAKGVDSIYQIDDGGLLKNDLKAVVLAASGELLRDDGSKVSTAQVSPSMWYRPSDSRLHQMKNGEQEPLNTKKYGLASDSSEIESGNYSETRASGSRHPVQLGSLAEPVSKTQEMPVRIFTPTAQQEKLVNCAVKTAKGMSGTGYCAEGVQRSLQCAYGIPNGSAHAYQMGDYLARNGFEKLEGITDPNLTPVGCINVYDSYAIRGTYKSRPLLRGFSISGFQRPKGDWVPYYGHIEVKTKDGAISDYVQRKTGLVGTNMGVSTTSTNRYYKLIGVYCKP